LHKGIVSGPKIIESISDRMLYIELRCRWCRIIVLNVFVPTDDKVDDVRGTFTRKWNIYSINFRNTIRNSIRIVNANVGRYDVFERKHENGNLHIISDANGLRVVNFITCRNFTIMSTIFPDRIIPKYNWRSPVGKCNQIDCVLRYVRRHLSVLCVQSLMAALCDTDHYVLVEMLGRD
jgi:hypothetical protein